VPLLHLIDVPPVWALASQCQARINAVTRKIDLVANRRFIVGSSARLLGVLDYAFQKFFCQDVIIHSSVCRVLPAPLALLLRPLYPHNSRPRSSSPASCVVKVAESVTGTGRFRPFLPLGQGFARYAKSARTKRIQVRNPLGSCV